MAVRRLAPNTVTFNSVLSACVAGHEWQGALVMFSAMGRAGDDEQDVQPNIITHTAAISACERRAQWALALHLLSELPPQLLIPSLVTYNSTVLACSHVGRWADVLRLLSDIRRSSLACDVETCGGVRTMTAYKSSQVLQNLGHRCCHICVRARRAQLADVGHLARDAPASARALGRALAQSPCGMRQVVRGSCCGFDLSV
mmetsp:Transcript_61439/g.198800  ORF Transcript_61439/g.198800 Transcript_61439/m.198800 type:complete len:201 (+) Transcript_61439:34-636(+)